MGTLNPNIPNEELNLELDAAGKLRQEAGQRLLTPEILLWAFLKRPDSAAHRLLEQFSLEKGFQLDDLESTVKTMAELRSGRDVRFDFIDQQDERVPLSDELTKVLDAALTIAESRDEFQTGTEHVLAAMTQPGMTTSGALSRYGLTRPFIEKAISIQSGGKGVTLVDYVALSKTSHFPPILIRTNLHRKIMSLLSLAQNRHIILIGPTGVGKKSLVLGLAKEITQERGPKDIKSVIQISEQRLLDNAEKALQAGLRRARGGILYIPHIHRFFGNRLDAEFFQAGSMLRKALLAESVVIIGSTDQNGYDRLMAKDPVVTEHSHSLTIPPASPQETAEILKILHAKLEAEYHIEISPDALKAAVKQADRYLAPAPLPGAAIQLMHRSAATLRAFKQQKKEQLDDEDVTLALSQMTGIPVNKLGTEERTRYARMVEHLHQRIIGQEEAVMAVSRAVKTARVGLKDPKRPIGSFLFLGPTGVGKTELAKALAEFMFGDEDAAIEIDMSEYQQEHSVNRLIGAPPGYVGYEGGGQLTDAVREHPYCVVLFDEVEKAHPRVADILLQVMEEGRLTDGQGRTTRFDQAVIILTSNLGSEFLIDSVIESSHRQLVMDEVKAHFRPEFLNRLDNIILFHPLSFDQLALILGLLLKKEIKLAAGSGITLEVTEAARQWLLSKNDHPEWGARPLRRIIRRHLREPLADHLLSASISDHQMIRADVKNKKLIFQMKAG